MLHHASRWIAACVIALIAGAAIACGSDDDADAPVGAPATETAAASQAPAPTPTPAPTASPASTPAAATPDDPDAGGDDDADAPPVAAGRYAEVRLNCEAALAARVRAATADVVGESAFVWTEDDLTTAVRDECDFTIEFIHTLCAHDPPMAAALRDDPAFGTLLTDHALVLGVLTPLAQGDGIDAVTQSYALRAAGRDGELTAVIADGVCPDAPAAEASEFARVAYAASCALEAFGDRALGDAAIEAAWRADATTGAGLDESCQLIAPLVSRLCETTPGLVEAASAGRPLGDLVPLPGIPQKATLHQTIAAVAPTACAAP